MKTTKKEPVVKRPWEVYFVMFSALIMFIAMIAWEYIKAH